MEDYITCHFCEIKRVRFKAVDGIRTADNQAPYCNNYSCPEKYCKFGHFTQGLIPDSECPFFVPKGGKR